MVSFDAVVREQGAAFARLARGYEADPDKQRDLVQEILVNVWRALPSFRGQSSVRTWALRVAHNVGAMHVRAAASRQRFVALEELEAQAAQGAIEAHGDLQRLATLVRSLRPADRQVVLLHLEGCTHAEIAEVTGLSAENAAVKVHRIKKALKQALEKTP